MEFDWTPEQDAYRERIRDVLARELPADWDHIAVHGPGSDEQTAFSRKFCPILADEGLFVFTVERAVEREPGPGYLLALHGRYAHAEDYVCGLLDGTGFGAIELEVAHLRNESGHPVSGLVCSATRRARQRLSQEGA